MKRVWSVFAILVMILGLSCTPEIKGLPEDDDADDDIENCPVDGNATCEEALTDMSSGCKVVFQFGDTLQEAIDLCENADEYYTCVLYCYNCFISTQDCENEVLPCVQEECLLSKDNDGGR